MSVYRPRDRLPPKTWANPRLSTRKGHWRSLGLIPEDLKLGWTLSRCRLIGHQRGNNHSHTCGNTIFPSILATPKEFHLVWAFSICVFFWVSFRTQHFYPQQKHRDIYFISVCRTARLDKVIILAVALALAAFAFAFALAFAMWGSAFEAGSFFWASGKRAPWFKNTPISMNPRRTAPTPDADTSDLAEQKNRST